MYDNHKYTHINITLKVAFFIKMYYYYFRRISDENQLFLTIEQKLKFLYKKKVSIYVGCGRVRHTQLMGSQEKLCTNPDKTAFVLFLFSPALDFLPRVEYHIF